MPVTVRLVGAAGGCTEGVRIVAVLDQAEKPVILVEFTLKKQVVPAKTVMSELVITEPTRFHEVKPLVKTAVKGTLHE